MKVSRVKVNFIHQVDFLYFCHANPASMKHLILTIILVLYIAASACLKAQNNDAARPGEVMVQLYNKQDLNTLLSDFSGSGLHHMTTVSQRFNIYLLTFDEQKTSTEALIASISKKPSVANVQGNHRISLRELNDTVPDDPFFALQWALDNYGQNGGYSDADIDAPEAWEYGTGGVTSHGDTIVIAIIDGGSDLNHEDLDFWKNKAEIPGNNIDDDTNGYIDDYDGWNAYVHSGYIPGNAHGVHVAGIAGAIGNNGKGIAGVNWNVKILPIAGESTQEATVVEALSYLYVVRERYDQTDGEEGAFVVADNCSFGVNEGQPEDYPIWEAMYDSLGKLGILSVGATANANWDIDVVGDIPTAFTTDYMISVTNTTNKDLKYSSAAYGATTIDLGAPGTIIQSLLPGDKYGTKTGTSMATPHVTGAIALLFSIADSTFIAQYKSDPGQFVLKVKESLLSSTDTLDDLLGKTVSGGRLNLYKAIESFLEQPFLAFSPDSLYAELLVDDIANDTLFITNAGSDTLEYNLTFPQEIDWLFISNTEGSLIAGQSDTVVVTFISDGIELGVYNTSLTLVQDNQDSTVIPVTMDVVEIVGVFPATDSETALLVYPNPFREAVYFDIYPREAGTGVLQIFDPEGRMVFETSRMSGTGKETISWHDKRLMKGIYYYRVFKDNELLRQGKVVRM